MDDTELARRWEELNREPALPRHHVATLRGAWWAWRSLHKARKDLAGSGLQARVAPPPAVPWGARTGVDGVLRRFEPTCLERCVVQQTWLFAHGIPRDVVIGVSRSGGDVRAHAWIDGMTHPREFEQFRPIHRIRPA